MLHNQQYPAWFNVFRTPGNLTTLDDLYQKYDQSQMAQSAKLLKQLIDQELDQLQGQSQNVFIGGFSQGCFVALATFVDLIDYRIGGVVGLSGLWGYRIDGDWSEKMDLELKRQTPLFLYHGTADRRVSFHRAKMSYSLFEKHGFSFEFHAEENLGHKISSLEISKVEQFL